MTAALPQYEPPAECSGATGFDPALYAELAPLEPIPNSSQFLLALKKAPADIKLSRKSPADSARGYATLLTRR